jgi:tetratricopeptide (TPR) repeat protein
MYILHKGLPLLTMAALLSACVTDGAMVRNEKPQAATLERSMAEADTALAAGRNEQAQELLKGAGTAYPADKAPWLRLAQLKFDRASYGEAITYAQEALQRDPNDKLGNSIVAVSGLRLSTKALADLSQQNNLNGSLRSEARIWPSCCAPALVKKCWCRRRQAARKTSPRRRVKQAASSPPAAKAATQNNTDPFSGLIIHRSRRSWYG